MSGNTEIGWDRSGFWYKDIGEEFISEEEMQTEFTFKFNKAGSYNIKVYITQYS